MGYIVRLNKGYWERLTTLIVSRNSVFGSNVVQDALVAALAKFLESEPESPLRTQQQLGAALRRISAVTAGRELGVLDFAELVDLTSELLVEQHRVSIAQGYLKGDRRRHYRTRARACICLRQCRILRADAGLLHKHLRACHSQAARGRGPQEMEDSIVAAPDAAPVIRGTGGIRKLRWAGSGRGKRGGIRVVFYQAGPDVIYLLTAYAKADREDLTPADSKALTRLVAAIKKELQGK